jgi:hypothetical protein
MTEKQKFMARIKRGEKLVGRAAIAAAGLGLGELYRSENGDFCLSTTRTLGIKTPAREARQQTSAEKENYL